MIKVGVILSGCGVHDGSEIHEAVSILLSLAQRGAQAVCMAPNKSAPVVNHLTNKPAEGETQNVLVESARIARGDILDLANVRGADYAAFVLPGGYGAAKNLCTFASKGPDCEVDPQVERVLREAHAAERPIGFACIAPAIAARVFGKQAPRLTIGQDAGTAAALEKMGAQHVRCDVREMVADERLRIATTPAYMDAKTIADVFAGIDKMVAQVLAWAR